MPRLLCLLVLLVAAPACPLAVEPQQSELDVWDALLRPQYFGDRPILSGQTIVQLRVPLRAEDSGVVPVSVNAKIAQTPGRYIEKLYLFIDKNPKPLAGLFHLTPAMGRADLAMRLRVNEFTKVRVIAELNDGELHMDEGFTRASGGCTEPPPFLALKEARGRIGQMKFRAQAGDDDPDLALAQLIISHPNVTGMQLDQRTRAYIPAEYVTRVVVSFNDEHVMTAETDISISEDPSFRFFFRPAGGGVIRAEMTDSKGRQVTRTFDVQGL
ncbi:MAG: quinoprotein dehydrogenase-associated SoxYZ-like carrier [Gammaproteobacteria bacterium]|nr:quinoprotein dehydrogenase-associated SoxYZ-like carrier [Gammaproteobacteria bacterium]